MRIVMAVAVVLAGAGCAAAQIDDAAMEAQRCVWRCLADANGADDPRYGACVAALCDADLDGDLDGDAVPAPVGWTEGPNADGVGRFAAATDPQRGVSFYFLCGPGGQSFFMLSGTSAKPGTLTLAPDGQGFAHRFAAQGGALFADVAVDAPVFAALWQAAQLDVTDAAGQVLGQFALAGAPAAISRAWDGCR